MKIKWAILGPGVIAHKFAEGLKGIEQAQIYAVGELEQFFDRACDFAKEYNIPKVYKGIDALCADKEIDVVYVSMINTMHKEAVLTCLKAGKNVLCEKPIAINKSDLEEMISCAKDNDVFLMEALWTNFIPAVVKTKKWLSSNIIGDIKYISADFGFRVEERTGRHFNKSLGGGVLLDVGTYTLGLPLVLMGDCNPKSIQSQVFICSEGVDEVNSITMTFDNGTYIRAYNSFSCTVKQDLYIYGTKGYIYLPDFWHTERAELYINGKLNQLFDEPFEYSGYNFEAQEVMDCLSEGKKESSLMPHSLSLSIMSIFDSVRSEAGIKYDCE